MDKKHKAKQNKLEEMALQESWFCLLAFLISIIMMVGRTLNLELEKNDFLTWLSFVLAIVFWIVIVKSKRCMANEKIKIFMDSFNKCAASFTILGNSLFYTLVIISAPKCILRIIIALIVIVVSAITVSLYKKTNES